MDKEIVKFNRKLNLKKLSEIKKKCRKNTLRIENML